MRQWTAFDAFPCWNASAPNASLAGTSSVSWNQLQRGCLEAFTVLDGRAPSLAHAMSRRCKDPQAVARASLFFVGIGHSHTRDLMGMLCMLGNHTWCGDFSSFHFHMPLYPLATIGWWRRQTPAQGAQFRLLYSASFYDQRIALIRACINLLPVEMQVAMFAPGSDLAPPNITDFFTADLGTQSHAELHARWDAELIAWLRKLAPSLLHVPTHFVLSRGAWDMHYLSPSLEALTSQMSRFLTTVHTAFPNAVLILQLPRRHVHWQRAEAMYKYRAVCASNARVAQMVDVNICAASRAIEHSGGGDGGRTLADKLVLFDTDEFMFSPFGWSFVDGPGHHYRDAALEVLALELRHIATSESVQRRYSRAAWLSRLRHANTQGGACSRVGDATKNNNNSNTNNSATANTPVTANVSSVLWGADICTCHRDQPVATSWCANMTSRLAPRDFTLFNKLIAKLRAQATPR